MMPPTIAEREAELAALQSAFDEYITSSRELEEELDAELAKMQEKLAESSAANAALSSQLENIAPQLGSLEKALTDTRHKLEQEQKLRRQAEQLQDEAEARCREAEGALVALKEDCDAAHEELAFKESELEETRLELEVEHERHRVEMEDLQLDLEAQMDRQAVVLEQQQEALRVAEAIARQVNENEENGGHSDQGPTTNGTSAPPVPVPVVEPVKEAPTFVDDDGFLSASKDIDEDDDNDYVKRLEDELELVTEQLIETEQRLTIAEDQLIALKESSEVSLRAAADSKEREDELLKIKEDHHKTIEELQAVKEELELAHEELVLTQEELKAAEDDVATFENKMDTMRAEHRDELTKHKADSEKAQSEVRTTAKDLENIEGALTKSAQDTAEMASEIENLHTALENAKSDHASALEELEQLYQKFDEAKTNAEASGREAAAEELKASMAVARQAAVTTMNEQISKLEEENKALQHRVDESEMALASANDAGQKMGDEQSETVQKLQDQLLRAREELGKKQEEVEALKNALTTRVAKAEEDVARLEKELSVTKGKLYEAEAHLIVSSKREKSRAAAAIPERSVASTGGTTSSPTKQPVEISEEIRAMEDLGRHRDGTDRKRSRSTSPTTPLRMRIQLKEEVTKADLMKKQLEELQEQSRISEKHTKNLEAELKTLQKQLFAGDSGAPVVTQMSRLSQLNTEGAGLLADDASSSVEDIIASGNTALIADELRSLEKKAGMQREYNAQLLSKILSLQGNIQVCCRVRPLSLREIQEGNKNNVESLSETELGCYDARNSKWKSFAFDKVWGPDQSQQSIFRDVEPLALSVVDGFNACIFAYGQTGSGKTYTMEGSPENSQYGISYRTIQKVFTLLNLRTQQQKAAASIAGEQKGFTFKLQLGMLEIYNDEIYDLLAAHASAGSKADQKREAKKAGVKATLDIKRSADGRIEVPDLTKEPVTSIEDVMALLKKGNASRSTAATNLNSHSSRSHMVLAVEVESGLDGEPSNKGILYLVDLAGSERVRKSQVEGEHLKEATHINKSLSALGNVMEALDRKASHVPYRDSKLTYLLQDAIGGNSRTMMVVTVCPTNIAYDESVHALQFATRVRRIQIGAAQRNVTSKNLEETIKALTTEMKQLSKAKDKSESQLTSLKRDNTRIQERLQTISTQRSKSSSDNKTLDVLRKNNNDMAARWNKEKALRERQAEDLEKSKLELRKKQAELTKVTREVDSLGRKLEEKELQLSQAVKDVRTAKDASSAANLRARKAQIIGSRHNASRPAVTTPARIRTPTAGVSTPTTASTATTTTTATTKRSTSPAPNDTDISEVREQVLELLKKHDKAKVDRIDIIMEKFKGKESLLVDKMTQRYEGGNAGTAAAAPASVSLQRRSEMALQRHKDRMQRRLEQQQKAKGK